VVRRLLDRIHHQGGTGRCWRIIFIEPGAQRQVISELNAAHDAEYAEVLERLPALAAGVGHGTRTRRLTYAEVRPPWPSASLRESLHRHRSPRQPVKRVAPGVGLFELGSIAATMLILRATELLTPPAAHRPRPAPS
jgi:hypothetical protein